MSIQDVLLAAGGFAIAGSLVPTMLDREARVPLWSSALIGSVLVMFAAVFASLHLWWATVGTILQVGCWGFIAGYRRAVQSSTTVEPRTDHHHFHVNEEA